MNQDFSCDVFGRVGKGPVRIEYATPYSNQDLPFYSMRIEGLNDLPPEIFFGFENGYSKVFTKDEKNREKKPWAREAGEAIGHEPGEECARPSKRSLVSDPEILLSHRTFADFIP